MHNNLRILYDSKDFLTLHCRVHARRLRCTGGATERWRQRHTQRQNNSVHIGIAPIEAQGIDNAVLLYYIHFSTFFVPLSAASLRVLYEVALPTCYNTNKS